MPYNFAENYQKFQRYTSIIKIDQDRDRVRTVCARKFKLQRERILSHFSNRSSIGAKIQTAELFHPTLGSLQVLARKFKLRHILPTFQSVKVLARKFELRSFFTSTLQSLCTLARKFKLRSFPPLYEALYFDTNFQTTFKVIRFGH